MLLLQLELSGWLLLGLALVHVIFPRYFDWCNELRPLSLINRQMMQVHTFFIALTVGLMGVLCLVAAEELVATPLGGLVCLGLGVFWFARLVVQLLWYSPALWRGKPFETVVHVMFIGLWSWLGGLFCFIYFAY